MPLKSLLVHLKPGDEDSPLLAPAADLAKSHGAKVTGLLALRDIATLKLILGENAAAVRARATDDARQSESLRHRFKAAMDQLGINSAFDVAEGDASEVLSLAGRCHDLIIVEQSGRRAEEAGWDVVEHTVMISGKPMLVMPRGRPLATIGKRVLIAWNGSREAARALTGALPLLDRAEHIAVLTGRNKDAFTTVTRAPQADPVAYLARHGINAIARPYDGADAQAGDAILAGAKTEKADLIVMGAYGRSWFREWAFGGATREVLREMDVPVLMAH